jgi:serine/threonine protein kinase
VTEISAHHGPPTIVSNHSSAERPVSALTSGTSIGPYEITAPIGVGGMGEVYRARDTRLDRVVAIKVSHERFSERLEREARAVAALNHPNICQLYDVGPDYLVLEYVEGAPVGPTENPRKLLDLAVQIADGLSAAHAAGFVHRDLKPDNILVTRDGRIKILDFGLVKETLVASHADAMRTMAITDVGSAVGTVFYMSPEQARGQAVDARSDQFSFGLILYEIATGRRAFQCDSAARNDDRHHPRGSPSTRRERACSAALGDRALPVEGSKSVRFHS